MSVTYCACAKVNLYLDITGRREDGYHLLNTVMQSIDLCDIVTVELNDTGKINVTTSDPLIPENEGNICHKAAKLLLEAVKSGSGVSVHVEKRIPSGAGLGGGSADAAAVLKGLNRLLGEPLEEKTLTELSVNIGADVPFCLTGGTKLCRGIGEILTDTEPFPEKTYLVVMPDFQCDTKSAYMKFDRSPIEPKKHAFTEDRENFPKNMYNVFQELYADERIEKIAETLLGSGAEGACLSGSGAAVFGVFGGEKQALEAAKLFPQYFTSLAKPVKWGVREV